MAYRKNIPSIQHDVKDLRAAQKTMMRISRLTSEEALTKLSAEYNNMSVMAMLETIAMKERDYYLSMHKYSIMPPKKDGRYKTFLPTEGGGRFLVARKKLKDLENIIINHYRNIDIVHSLSSLLEDFLEDRKKFVRVATIDRDRTSFHRFFDGTSIIQKDVREITRTELNDFCLETMIRLRLDKKGYQRLKSLLNALWDYAVNIGYSESNIARNIKPLGPAFFTPDGNLDMEEISEKIGNLNIDIPNKKECASSKKNAPQYYSGEEQAKLISVCYQKYLALHNTAYLAIILCFCLGLRIGELVALKPEDFDFKTGVVHIRRREVSSKDETGKRCFRISERLKNGASRRDIPITSTCKFIYDLIMQDNKCRGTSCEYLLVSCQNDDRMHSCSVDLALDRANNDAGLTQRSLHKIRKTVLSRLDMSRNFTVERIREIAGHSRESITLYTNYFYTIEGLEGISRCRTFEEVVEYKMPSFKRIDRLNQPLIFRRAI